MSSYDMLYSKFYDAIEEHDTSQIEACKRECRSNRSAISQDAIDDLFGLACGEGDIDTASFLLSIGANINAKDENSGATALIIAASYNQLKTVEWLISKGANLNLKSNLGTTALHSVCTPSSVKGTSNHYAIAKALLNAGADVNARDNSGETPLHRASQCGLKDTVKLLLDSGANKNITDYEGLTAVQRLEMLLDFFQNASPMERMQAERMLPFKFDTRAAAEIIDMINSAPQKPTIQPQKTAQTQKAASAPSSSSDTKSSSSSGCYVATAVYGSYDCPQVWTLRRYRDLVLAESWYGRAFIKAYYAISPTLVRWFGETSWFKSLWRGKLDHMVNALQTKGFESSPYEDRVW